MSVTEAYFAFDANAQNARATSNGTGTATEGPYNPSPVQVEVEDPIAFENQQDAIQHHNVPESNEPPLVITDASQHKHVRLSWVQRMLPEVSGRRPTSSVYGEIRSLLSWGSVRSSLISLTSSRNERTDRSTRSYSTAFGTELTPPMSLGELAGNLGQDNDRYNTNLVMLCCKYRTNCLHRKLLTAMKGYELPQSLQAGHLTALDFSPSHGRDIYGDTILHLAARWDASPSLFCMLYDRAKTEMINVKNISNATFMHILGRQWIQTQPDALLAILVRACGDGLNHLARDDEGRNVFASFLPASTSQLSSHELRQISEGLLKLLKAPHNILVPALLSSAPGTNHSTVREYVADRLQHLAEWSTDHLAMTRALVVVRHLRSLASHVGRVPASAVTSDYNTFHLALESLTGQERFGADSYEALLAAGADPNDYNGKKMPCATAVVHHIAIGHLSETSGIILLKLLCQYNASLCLVDNSGNTALHFAVQFDLGDVVATLIDLGADIMARNIAGQTVLGYISSGGSLRRSRDREGKGYARAQRTLVRIIDALAKRKPAVLNDFISNPGSM